MVDGYWLEVLPKDYVIEQNGFCIVGFMENGQDYWVLGDAFFRGYYVIHDEQNRRIGIAPHATSTKSDLLFGDLPT